MIIIRAKKEINLKDKNKILAQIKADLPPLMEEICNELGHSVDILLGIPMDFAELDVSAKTIDSKIYLNEDLLLEPYKVILRYVVHEATHALQHMNREHLDHDPFADDDYLDRGDELEAFQNQIKFQKKTDGEEAAREYVEELVEYHEVPEDSREEKIDELLNG